MKITEGYMPFRGLQTYYRVCGDLNCGITPLVLLHGGPGSSHNYFETLDPIAEQGRPLVMYDQIGCGESPAEGHTELFNRETWADELQALLDHLGIREYFLMGQSWGGMLLLEHTCGRPHGGLKGIVLASTLPSSALWGKEQRRLIQWLPEEHQRAIAEADETGDYSTPAYQAANDCFMHRHSAPVWTEDYPECVRRKKKSGREAYVTGWGPNEFTPLGNLKDFDWIDELKNITVPALVTSGLSDMCTPLIAKLMYDEIPDSEWQLFEHSRHCAFVEENGKYLEILKDWLDRHDR